MTQEQQTAIEFAKRIMGWDGEIIPHGDFCVINTFPDGSPKFLLEYEELNKVTDAARRWCDANHDVINTLLVEYNTKDHDWHCSIWCHGAWEGGAIVRGAGESDSSANQAIMRACIAGDKLRREKESKNGR